MLTAPYSALIRLSANVPRSLGGGVSAEYQFSGSNVKGYREGDMLHTSHSGTTVSSTELYLLLKHYGLTERSTKGGLGGSTVGPKGPPARGSVRESCSEG